VVATDDVALMRMLAAVLGDAGHGVVRSADGLDLLHQLRASVHPLVVLLSLRRSRLNSRDVLAAIAAERALATSHGYVLLTALWDALPHDYATLIRDLSVTVMPKPFDIDALLETVAQVGRRLALP
jgi:DNA-binding NtrC family response regulator